MKRRYEVIVSRRAERMLMSHIGFLANVSVRAAKRLRTEYAAVLRELEDNPYQFPIREDQGLPGEYRKALFYKRYEAIFSVEDDTAFLDAILDCRMDNSGDRALTSQR